MTCVYLHYRLDTNEVFYVGIGNKKRPYKIIGRNDHWTKVFNKAGRSVHIVAEVETWEQAVQMEIELIAKYGRVDLGTGSLVNKTSGGEGTIGVVYTAEYRSNMSASKKGKKVSPDVAEKLRTMAIGRKHTPEAIEKIRVWNTGRKMSQEANEKNRLNQLGKKLKLETIAKIVEANTGKKRSKEQVEKMRLVSMGKKHTDEAKEKIRSKALGRKMSTETIAKRTASYIATVAARKAELATSIK